MKGSNVGLVHGFSFVVCTTFNSLLHVSYTVNCFVSFIKKEKAVISHRNKVIGFSRLYVTWYSWIVEADCKGQSSQQLCFNNNHRMSCWLHRPSHNTKIPVPITHCENYCRAVNMTAEMKKSSIKQTQRKWWNKTSLTNSRNTISYMYAASQRNQKSAGRKKTRSNFVRIATEEQVVYLCLQHNQTKSWSFSKEVIIEQLQSDCYLNTAVKTAI